MKIQLTRNLLLISLSMLITGCGINWPGQSQTTTVNENGESVQVTSKKAATGQPVGGSIEESMDANDKIKLSRAMDAAPGKSTDWTNPVNGAQYSVTPLQKVSMPNARFCRTYRITMTRQGAQEQVTGTACISGTDGTWHVV